MSLTFDHLRIAVIVPCFNEAVAIGQVIDEIKAVLPEASVHVFDNNSTDATTEVARTHGAQVSTVKLQGKGNVVRRMFADVDADVYIMTDGDATYDMSHVREHIALLVAGRHDMVVGCRQDEHTEAHTYRRGHRLGNRLLTNSVKAIFGGRFSDMLSGYRLFSRRYVKSFPANARRFETETELTVHALELRMSYVEVPVIYKARPEGSFSKLSTYRDGWRILKTILTLFISEKPLAFFALLSAALALLSVGLAVPLFDTYWATGLVPRLPTAILVTGLMLMSVLSLVCGAILHTVTIGRREQKQFCYLSVPVLQAPPAPAAKPR
jgi:glycosyltransferase involved in cell wall biosynthesis